MLSCSGNMRTRVKVIVYSFNTGQVIDLYLFPSQFMALLGLFKDPEPLTSEVANPDRVWKTSKFAGYGSNLGFLLSTCGNDR